MCRRLRIRANDIVNVISTMMDATRQNYGADTGYKVSHLQDIKIYKYFGHAQGAQKKRWTLSNVVTMAVLSSIQTAYMESKVPQLSESAA